MYGIEYDTKYIGTVEDAGKWSVGASEWEVTMFYEGREMTVPFFQGSLYHGLAPELGNVLYCLFSDADSVADTPFEEWCADFGYDTDSRKALATYEQCESIGFQLGEFLGWNYWTTQEQIRLAEFD